MLLQSQSMVKDLDRQLKERITPKEHQTLLEDITSFKEAVSNGVIYL